MTHPALACPFCRTRSARFATEGYSTERGVPENDARYMGLWQTRTVGTCDQCGESWGLASKGVATTCPSCGSTDSGRFGHGVQRNCWECGEVWQSPSPARPKSRFDRLMDAVGMTVLLGVTAVFVFWGVLILGAVVVVLYVAPIFLFPVGLIALVVAFFYFMSGSKAKKRKTR